MSVLFGTRSFSVAKRAHDQDHTLQSFVHIRSKNWFHLGCWTFLCILALSRTLAACAESACIDPSPAPSLDSVANLVRWTGSLPEAKGQTLDVLFSLYEDRAEGLALWTETQTVTVGADGCYTVLLGATSADGLPKTLFQAGAARWIEIKTAATPAGPSQEENSVVGAANVSHHARSMLAAVPYAFKSMDSETLAGHAASDYVTREDLKSAVADQVTVASKLISPGRYPIIGVGQGTPGYLSKWTSQSTVGDSLITESGLYIGIRTPSPKSTLDVNGATILRGPTSLQSPDASPASGVDSPGLQLEASSYSSANNASVAQNFVWQAVSVGNNTSVPSANLALLFGSGYTAPVPTGLSIASNGQITFAPGQTFPGMDKPPASGGSSGTLPENTAGPIPVRGKNIGSASAVAPIQISAGGTGATRPSDALANLGGLPLAGGTMTGPMKATSAIFSSSVTAASASIAGNFAIGNTSLDFVCSGTASDAINLQSAINSLNVYGSTLRLHGWCSLSGLGSQIITIPTNNYLRVDCGSWNETVLSIANSVPNTTDVFRIVGPSSGVTIENCLIEAQSSKANSVIDLDASNGPVKTFTLNHNNIQTNGSAIITTVPAGTVDGVFDGLIENSVIEGGIYLYNGGDQIMITQNLIISPGIGVYAKLVPGALGPNVYHNTITSCGGAVVVDAALSPEILYNEIEPHGTCGPETNGASIDIRGTSVVPVNSPIIEGNTGSISDSSLGQYLVRVDYAADAKIDKNTCYSHVTGQVCIKLTANPAGTILGANTTVQRGGKGILLDSTEADLKQTSIVPYSASTTPSSFAIAQNTFGCLDGYNHLPCIVAQISPTLYSGSTNVTTSLLTPLTSGSYQMCGYVDVISAAIEGNSIVLSTSYTSDQTYQNGIGMAALSSPTTQWSVSSGCVQFYSDASQPIGVSLLFSGVVGVPTIRYWVTLERVQ